MFLVRPRPETGESSQGYLLRLAEENCLPSVRSISVQLLKEHLESVTARRFLRGPIAGLRNFASPDQGQLAARYWNTRRPRYCPHCLVVQPIWLSLWQLVFYVACHVHRTALIDRCQGCKAPLQWSRGSLLSCACGAELVQVEAMSASASDLATSVEIAHAWQNGVTANHRLEEIPKIEHVLHRIWLLGSYRAQVARRAQKLFDLDQLPQAQRIVEAAADTLSDWPMEFFNLLDQVAARSGRGDSTRLTERFGAFYQELFDPKRGEELAPLRLGFEQYIAERWSGQLAARNRRLAPRIRDEHQWVPVTRAAKELHWSPTRLRAAIERGVVRGHLRSRPSGRIAAVVHRDDLVRLMADVSTWIDLKAVCKFLRLGKKRVNGFVAERTLVPVAGPSVDAHPVWQFRSDDVEALRAIL